MSADLYRERAHLIALAATIYPAVITRDPGDPDWPIIYLDTPAGQISWHLSERDLDLFPHVEHTSWDDERAAWDGHTTPEKLARVAQLAQRNGIADRLTTMHKSAAARRRALGLSLRDAAKQIGIGFNTLARVEKGEDCSLGNSVAILRWLDQPESETRP